MNIKERTIIELKDSLAESVAVTSELEITENILKVVSDLSIPGISDVAKPIGEILGFFKPSELDETNALLKEALEKMNDAYGMMLEALTEKAVEIYASNIKIEVKSIVNKIKVVEKFGLNEILIADLTTSCDNIFKQVEHVITESSILITEYTDNTKHSDGMISEYIGTFTQYIMSCYQAVAVAHYGLQMVTHLFKKQDEKYKLQAALYLIQLNQQTFGLGFINMVINTVPNSYPKWCLGLFTQKPISFINSKWPDKYMYLGEQAKLKKSMLLFSQNFGSPGFFYFQLTDKPIDAGNEGTRWEMYAIENGQKIPLYTYTKKEKKSGNAYSVYSGELGKPEKGYVQNYVFGLNYDHQKIQIRPNRFLQSYNLCGQNGVDFLQTIDTNDDNSMWISETVGTNIPKFGHDEFPMTPIEAINGENWFQKVMNTSDNTTDSYTGIFDIKSQWMASEYGINGVKMHEVVAYFPAQSNHYVSYVCVYSGGVAFPGGAEYVDVSTQPNEKAGSSKYKGWNGTDFVDGPAKSENGFYWYRKEIFVDSSLAISAGYSAFYAKTYRAQEKPLKMFMLWAYTSNEVLDTFPTPPFNTEEYPISPIIVQNGEEWFQKVMNTKKELTSTPSGNFDFKNQLMASVRGIHGEVRQVVVGSFPPMENQYVSYICVGGAGAKDVIVSTEPNEDAYEYPSSAKYLGWNGSSFQEEPAINVNGYYWYRKEILVSSSLATSSGVNVFVAKTDRADYEEVNNKEFRLWAYTSNQALDIFPRPPFNTDEYPMSSIEALNGKEWFQKAMNTDKDLKSTPSGNFDFKKQNMASVHGKNEDRQVVIGSFPGQSNQYVSYICVGGAGANDVDVSTIPKGTSPEKYLGWNGSSFQNKPAINVNGYYWYRKEIFIDKELTSDSGSNVFFAKTYRAEGDHKEFWIWAFIHKTEDLN